MAQCHKENKDWDDSIECYEAVIDAEPNNLVAMMELAKVYESSDQPEKALAMLSTSTLDFRTMNRSMY